MELLLDLIERIAAVPGIVHHLLHRGLTALRALSSLARAIL